jgi:hypothetical protein
VRISRDDNRQQSFGMFVQRQPELLMMVVGLFTPVTPLLLCSSRYVLRLIQRLHTYGRYSYCTLYARKKTGARQKQCVKTCYCILIPQHGILLDHRTVGRLISLSYVEYRQPVVSSLPGRLG